MSSPATPTLVISVLTNGDDLVGSALQPMTPEELAFSNMSRIYFKVKTTTKMHKLLTAYLERRCIPLNKRDALCFLTPTNHVISGHESSNALDLSDGDQLRCVFDRKNLP